MADEIQFDNELIEQIAARPLSKRTWREFLYLLSVIPSAIVASVIWSLSLSFAASIIGIPLLVGMLWIVRYYSGFERTRQKIIDPREIEVVYPPSEGNLLDQTMAKLGDVQTWKELGWLIALSTVGVTVAVFGIGVWAMALGWVLYPLWGWAVPGDWTPLFWLTGDDVSFFESFLIIPFGLAMAVVATWVNAGITLGLTTVARALLGSAEDVKLRGRVTDLERSREETFSQQSTEMSRIERDLHDGAQARLVALAMDLGMAEQKLNEDPDAAKDLITQAKGEAQKTLEELRDLVRGLGPQILRDRGLEAALVPLVARSPIEVDLSVDLPAERPSERVEAAAYFIASEALTNAIKHSEARQINVNLWNHTDWLYLRVSDNGVGGAKLDGADASGLRGLRTRAENVDGRLMIDSPTGGPTIIDVWLPMK